MPASNKGKERQVLTFKWARGLSFAWEREGGANNGVEIWEGVAHILAGLVCCKEALELVRLRS